MYITLLKIFRGTCYEWHNWSTKQVTIYGCYVHGRRCSKVHKKSWFNDLWSEDNAARCRHRLKTQTDNVNDGNEISLVSGIVGWQH